MRYAASVVGVIAVLSGVAMAQPLPKDTNEITTLTIEQARSLAAEFPGATAKQAYGGKEWTVEGCLPLNGMRSLDVETAKALAAYRRGPLLINGLAELSAEAAAALATRSSARTTRPPRAEGGSPTSRPAPRAAGPARPPQSDAPPKNPARPWGGGPRPPGDPVNHAAGTP